MSSQRQPEPTEQTKRMGAEVPFSLNRRIWTVVIARDISVSDAINEALALWAAKEEKRLKRKDLARVKLK